MTRKAAMNQWFNLIQDEYEIKSASDIEAALLDMFESFIERVLEADLDQHLGYNRYDFCHKSTSNIRNECKPKTIQTCLMKQSLRWLTKWFKNSNKGPLNSSILSFI